MSLQRPSLFLRPFRPPSLLKSSPRRHFATPQPPQPPKPKGTSSSPRSPSPSVSPSTPKYKDPQSRLHRLNNRLPRFLRSYTTPLLGAPGTHITSFLILHEITAIVPLLGLVAAFHYGNWLPDLTANSGFEEGVRRFGRWLRKRGWVDDDVDVHVDVDVDGVAKEMTTRENRKGVRLVVEFATAYAVTKAFLPVRIAVSVWATPWFARAILAPLGRGARKLLGK